MPDLAATPVPPRVAADGRRSDRARAAQRHVDISVIMPTACWSGAFGRCGQHVVSQADRATGRAEVLFAFDGPAKSAPRWVDRANTTVVKTGTRSGPAAARNAAARAARGQILFFVDSDVELAADAIDRVVAAFDADPDLVAMFGTYDDEPPGHCVASTFRNLLHHHTHASNAGAAQTFWAGCGAIRAAAFQDLGGFDENYRRPCVEDIELGMRITANGGRIVLDPGLRCKHLKHWTLGSMVVTDVTHRAVPWTRLIMNTGHVPGTLNLDWRGRLSGICSLTLVACLAAMPFLAAAAWGALACMLALLAMNRCFYGLCLRKRGLRFALAAIALHWLYFVYSSLTFAAVAVDEMCLGTRPAKACPSGDAVS